MGLVPCPNNGACGSRSHNQKSARYRECLASARFSGRGTSVSGMIVPKAPNDDDGSSEKLHVMYPHFVLTDGMGGVYNNPVQLHGDYVIDLPSREDRRHGAESGILDDMTMDRFRCFNYPDGVGLSQYSAADVYRTFE